MGNQREALPLALIAAGVSTATALFLILLKFWGGLHTHAMTLWALTLDSFLDLTASLVNLVFIHRSLKPPSEAFPYGFGKSESIAALSQSYFLLFTAGILGYESVKRMWGGGAPVALEAGIAVLGISWVITLVLTGFLKWAARKTDSLALRADSFHYETDLLTNLAGVVGLFIMKTTGIRFIDAALSLAIVVYMLYGAARMAFQSIQELLDRSITPEERRRILHIIHHFHDAMHTPHNFRARRSGPRIFMEFHVEVERGLSFEDSHNLVEDLIERIRQEFPGAEVTVHVDPAGTNR